MYNETLIQQHSMLIYPPLYEKTNMHHGVLMLQHLLPIFTQGP